MIILILLTLTGPIWIYRLNHLSSLPDLSNQYCQSWISEIHQKCLLENIFYFHLFISDFLFPVLEIVKFNYVVMAIFSWFLIKNRVDVHVLLFFLKYSTKLNYLLAFVEAVYPGQSYNLGKHLVCSRILWQVF